MIRVVHVLGDLSTGGVESFVMEIYRKIDKTKIQFDFLIHNLKNEKYRQEIEKLGGRVFLIDKFNFKNPLKYIRDLDFILENHKEISILHCHFRGTEPIILKRAKKHGLLTISHNHGPQNYSKFKTFLRNVFKSQVLKYSDLKLVCSDQVGTDYFGKDSYIKINNGIDLEKYKFTDKIRQKIRKELNISDNYVLINVGSLSEIKNQEFLINLMPDLVKKDPSIRMILAGDGDLRSVLENLSKDLGVNDKVIFLGTSDRVNELLMASDLFLFPSLREGLGIAAIEAQASGLKSILSTNVPSEVNVTDKIIFLDLDPKKWVTEIIKSKDYKREDQLEKIKDAGYDIKLSALDLSFLYYKLVDYKI